MGKFNAYDMIPVLPWENDTDQDRLYRRILLIAIIVALIICLIVPMLPHKDKSKAQKEKIPERLAKMVIKQKKKKPPKPPPKVAKTIKKIEKKKEEKKKKKKKKKIKKPKNEKEKKAREVAAKKLKEAEKLFKEMQDIKIDLSTKPLAKGGAQAKQADRKLITSRATSGSGGIQVATNVSADSSGFGGSGKGKALVGMATTQVGSNIGDGIGGGGGGGGNLGYRTSEEIRKVFDAKKGLLFSLYQRALRKNPTLQGTILLHLRIAPTGQVTLVEVVSSEINDPELVRKIVSRVKTFNFGEADVEVWDDNFPVTLVPS